MGGYVALRDPAPGARAGHPPGPARQPGPRRQRHRHGPPPPADGPGRAGRVPRRHPAPAAPVHPPRRGCRTRALRHRPGHGRDTGKDGFLRQQTAILGRPDSRPGLPAIACPTLVLAGRDDAVTPPKLQLEMATLIPDATLVLLPRCGHLAPLERPDAVTRQLLALARRLSPIAVRGAQPRHHGRTDDRTRPDPRFRLAIHPADRAPRARAPGLLRDPPLHRRRPVRRRASRRPPSSSPAAPPRPTRP